MNGAANGLPAPRGTQGRLANAALGALMAGVAPAGPRSRLSIVIFHRVHAQPDPLFPDDVDEQRFNAICAWLAAWYHVLPLDEAVQRLAEGRLPARPLCITFDDGYADNHDRALPILRAHGLCATFFIATGFLDGGRMWNDTVVESIRRCAEPGLDLSALRLPGIGLLDLRSVAARRASMHSLLNAAKYLPPPQRQQVVDRVGALAGVHLPGDLMMRSDQVRAMAAAGMQIGAHTVTHPILARLDDEQARTEMQRSKAELESLLGRPVDLFAYPNGKPGQDYLPRDAQLARALGFRAAVSTVPGAARQGDGRMHELPRFTPWDQQRWRFGARMLRNVLADRPGA